MTIKSKLLCAVVATVVMVKLPAAATTDVTRPVVSADDIHATTCDAAVTRELVTTTDVPAAAMLTRPDGLLIVTAPTVSAAQGSIYIRTDGSTVATRLYVNTTGAAVWTNFTSAT